MIKKKQQQQLVENPLWPSLIVRDVAYNLLRWRQQCGRIIYSSNWYKKRRKNAYTFRIQSIPMCSNRILAFRQTRWTYRIHNLHVPISNYIPRADMEYIYLWIECNFKKGVCTIVFLSYLQRAMTFFFCSVANGIAW